MNNTRKQVHFLIEETFENNDIDKRKEILEQLFLEIIKKLKILNY